MQLNRRRMAQTSLAALAAACTHGGQAEAPALEELIVHGGPIYTGLPGQRVEALRIRDGRIVFAGALEDAYSPRIRLIDLQGAAAFPGFIDSHVHLGGVGMAAMVLDLVGVPSIAALQQRLANYAAEHPEGAIVGRGWIETHWPEARFPNRADLDAVVNDRPVMLRRIDGHAALVNSALLALSGIDASTPDPDGGLIERDGDGAPTGILIDNAMGMVSQALPAPSAAMQRDAMRQAVQLYASRGWTGAGNMSTSIEESRALHDFARAGELPLRADIYLEPEAARFVVEHSTPLVSCGGAHTRGIKLYSDGALGSRGAALLAPYADADGEGVLVTPPDELRDMLAWARANRLQAATHAIGDRGNRIVLDAYREVFADAPEALRTARWRVEHAQVLAHEDIPRFAAMGVIASMQPSHAISDLHFAPARLGAERLRGAYAWRTLLDSGAAIAAGSDAPVEKGDPLIEFYAACHRRDLEGRSGEGWHLEQAVSRAEALKMLTWGGAYAAHSETERGTLEPGKLADVSVFSVDLMRAPPSEIPTAQAMLTMCGGRITHSAL